MPLSLAGRPGAAEAMQVFRAFLDGGGDFIDTANVYCLDTADIGHNERLVAAALRHHGAGRSVIVATKGGLNKEGGGWDCDGSPAWLRRSCERSLSDLGVERIFLYQLHAPDPRVPFAESVGELARLQDEGKIAHVGLSNVSIAQIRSALDIVPICSVQNKCSVASKRAFRDGVVAFCDAHDIAFIAHSPVGGHRAQARLQQSAPLLRIAARHGVSAAQLALSWLLHQGRHIIPIPGASRVASIQDSLSALDIRLSADEVAALEQMPDW